MRTLPIISEKIVLGVIFAVAITTGVVSYRQSGPYGDRHDFDPRVRRFYDRLTGRLTLIMFDANEDMGFDTWAYMDGEQLKRMDIDTNADGIIDRREYYVAGEHLQRIEYLAAGRVVRTEFYDNGTLIRTEAAIGSSDGNSAEAK
jgi:hypothetical protein